MKVPIQESALVGTIALPNPMEEIPEHTSLIVTGFGSSSVNGPLSKTLKKMRMFVVSTSNCSKYWPTLDLLPSQMCAALSPKNGVCQGDSGGALTYNRKVIYGIVSATNGTACGTGSPDIFTKVSHFIDYIEYEMSF